MIPAASTSTKHLLQGIGACFHSQIDSGNIEVSATLPEAIRGKKNRDQGQYSIDVTRIEYSTIRP